MKTQFFELADALCRGVRDGETLLCAFSGERSDFIRFNKARVRQAGTVEQRYLSARLIRGQRQVSATLALTGDSSDLAARQTVLAQLREILPQVPEDPWLLFAQSPHATTDERRGYVPAAEEVVSAVTNAPADVDFVGFYAGGGIYRGFANSLGQRNWHAIDTFNLDWSVYLRGDKAVKEGYAGFDWNASAFQEKLGQSLQRLDFMRRPPRTLAPGEYRAYLAPRALEEIVGLLAWDSFSARARATRQSALLLMEHGTLLSPKVSLAENTQGGVAPAFQEEGFARPPSVPLIVEGRLRESLVSARSSREYGSAANGANARETPESLDMSRGGLEAEDVLSALDTGLFVSNLWYLNFSDKAAARITGMTRFATFWVERGRIVSPVTPLRFDDTLYRVLGENLLDLTRSRELLLSTSTYHERSTSSARLPGALVQGLRFTL